MAVGSKERECDYVIDPWITPVSIRASASLIVANCSYTVHQLFFFESQRGCVIH